MRSLMISLDPWFDKVSYIFDRFCFLAIEFIQCYSQSTQHPQRDCEHGDRELHSRKVLGTEEATLPTDSTARTQGKGTGVLAPPTASTGLASPSCVNRDRQRPAGSPARAATFPECHSLSSSLIPMLLLPLSLSDDINDRLLAKLRHLQMDGKQKQWLCRVR